MNRIKKVSVVNTALCILLVGQFYMIAFCNLTLIDQNLDCDNAKLFRHVMEMYSQRTLAIPEWSYTTTLEYDCGALFALPLYALTHNIYLSFGIANIVLTGIFIAVIFFLFEGKEITYPLLCANLICIPYRTGMLDYYNMMFFCGSQYIIKVMTPIILVALLVCVENAECSRRKKAKVIFYTLLYLVFFLITCISSGTYVALCGMVPIGIAYLVYKFIRWEKIPLFAWCTFIGSGACFLLGIKANRVIMGGTRGDTMAFCSVYQLLANISSAFFGMFELFGGTTTESDMQILSLEGIALLGKLCFVILLLICAVIVLIRCIRKKADMRLLILLTMFFWNYFILNVANTRAGSATSEYRYHLIGMIPLICAATVILIEGIGRLQGIQQKCIYMAVCGAILFLSTVSYKNIMTQGELNADLKELCEYSRNQDFEYVYMYEASNDSDICRAIDDSTTYLYVSGTGVVWTYDFYSCYVDAVVQPENTIVAVDYTKYLLEDTFTIGNYTLEKFETVGNRNLYRFK